MGMHRTVSSWMSFGRVKTLSRFLVAFLSLILFTACSMDATLSSLKLEFSTSLTKLEKLDKEGVPADGQTGFPLQVQVYNIKKDPVVGYTAVIETQGQGIITATCEPTNASGVAPCFVSSSEPGEKLVFLANDVIQNTVPILFYDPNSSISVGNPDPAPANGQGGKEISVVILDKDGNPIVGETPVLDIGGSGNNQYICQPSDASGISKCVITSDTPGDKVVTVINPKIETPVTVTFEEPLLQASSKIAKVDVNGNNIASVANDAKVTISVYVLDSSKNPLASTTPTLSLDPATGSDFSCSASNSEGVATCQVSSQVEGAKKVQISAPTASTESLTIYFSNGLSTVTAASATAPADNSTELSIVISLKDHLNNPQIGHSPTCQVNGAGQNSIRCSMSDVNGDSTCYIKSTKEGSKNLFCSEPLIEFGNVATFTPSISVVTSDEAKSNGVDTNSATIILKDVNGNIIVGGLPVFEITPQDHVTYHCTASDSLGYSNCYFSTDTPGTYEVQVTSPVGSQTTFELNFTSSYSDLAVVNFKARADGIETTEVRVTLMESSMVPMMGVTPSLDIQGAGQNIATCSSTGITGTADCVITSTVPGLKKIKVTYPLINKTVTVSYSDSRSTLEEYQAGTLTAYAAAATSYAKVLVTLKNHDGSPRAGVLPQAQVTGAGTLTKECTVTDANGESICTVQSDTVGVKVFSIIDPLIDDPINVNFISTVQACTVDFGNGNYDWQGPGFNDFGACHSITCDTGYTFSGGICKEFNAPTGEGFTIASGAVSVSSTSVVLSVTCPTDESGAVEMTAGSAANVNTGWVACNSLMNYTLSAGDGTKTVYMRFRDRFQNTTVAISDDIILDQSAPVGGMCSIPNTNAAVGTPNINLDITCPTDLSPPVKMAISNSANPNAGWVDCQTTYPHTLVSGTGPKSVFMRFMDALGQVTASDVVANVNLDQTGPVSTLVYANGYQVVTSMSVALTAVDDYSTVDNCELGLSETALTSGALDTFSVYTPVAGTGNGCGSYMITGQSGKAYKFQGRSTDGFGNVGTSVTGTNVIRIDTTAPLGGSITNSNSIQTTSAVAITVNQGSDIESGMSGTNGDYSIQVSQATFANPTCGAFGAFGSAGLSVTAAGTNYTYTGVAGHCYKFRYTTMNQAGLSTTYDGASVTKIDYTYSWSSGTWGTCDAAQPSWQTGTFGTCSAAQPAWSAGGYGTCTETAYCSYQGTQSRSVTCPTVGGTQTRSVTCPTSSGNQARTVQCVRSDSTVVADAYCVAAKPPTTQACSRNDCAGAAPSTTTACSRGGGTDCSGTKPATSRSCSDFYSSCDGGGGDGGD